jgi:serine/threonine-protein kinase HipA
MTITNIPNCLITLAPSETAFSPKGKKALLGNRMCNHILPYTINEAAIANKEKLIANQTRISISGVQEKYSLQIQKKEFVLTDTHGTYILKPKTTGLKNNEYVPMNEHVTMLIAKNVFKIETAICSLVLFADGEPAYITKRFDIAKDGSRYLKEDFASVLQRTNISNGKNYKYDSSYQKMAEAIDKFIPAATIQKEKLFKLAVFNYLISNGDAHLKNFSIISYDMAQPYYVLAPAYDLLCTRLHIDDGDFAFTDRLYDGDEKAAAHDIYGFHTYTDFYDFGLRIKLLPIRIKKKLDGFLNKTQEVEKYVAYSYLSEPLKLEYLNCFYGKLKRLEISKIK